MEFDFLSDKQFQDFTQKGKEVLYVSYKDYFSKNEDIYTVSIYSFDEKYAITLDLGHGYGPIDSYSEALQWAGFEYTIEDFELSSTIIEQSQLNAIEQTFLNRMNAMVDKNPSLITKIDLNALWAMLEVHKKYPNFRSADLRSFLAPRSVYAGGPLDTIVVLTREKKYLKILFTYGIDTIQELMCYFLKQEDYLICKAIHQTIMNHNTLTDNNLCSIKELVKTSDDHSNTPEDI
jgi:hypothetical protein